MSILQSFGKAKSNEEPKLKPEPKDYVTDYEVNQVNQRREERANRKSQFVPTGSDGTGRLRRARMFPSEVVALFPDHKPGYLEFLDGVWKVGGRGNFEIVYVAKPIWFYPGIEFGCELPSYAARHRGVPDNLPCCYYCGRNLFWRDIDGHELCGLCRMPKFWHPDFNVLVREWFLKGSKDER